MRRVMLPTVVAAILAAFCFIDTTDAEFTDICLGCMAHASTNFTTMDDFDPDSPCIAHDWGTVCGPWSITKPYWQDGYCHHDDSGEDGTSECAERYYNDCVKDFGCNMETVRAYLGRYVTISDGHATCEKYARTHSGGPWGQDAVWADAYWVLVQDCCANLGASWGSDETVCNGG